jgi:hypothetical protein
VRPLILLDEELDSVAERDAMGITVFRSQMNRLFDGTTVGVMERAKTVELLQEEAKRRRVLILKTDFTLPYSSIFIQLDHREWTSAAETRLREEMAKKRRGR